MGKLFVCIFITALYSALGTGLATTAFLNPHRSKGSAGMKLFWLAVGSFLIAVLGLCTTLKLYLFNNLP